MSAKQYNRAYFDKWYRDPRHAGVPPAVLKRKVALAVSLANNGSRYTNAINKTREQVFGSNGTVLRSVSRTFNTLGELTSVVDGLNHRLSRVRCG